MGSEFFTGFAVAIGIAVAVLVVLLMLAIFGNQFNKWTN
jgi:hypothetical protein